LDPAAKDVVQQRRFVNTALNLPIPQTRNILRPTA